MKSSQSRWSLRARLTALAIAASCVTALVGAFAAWSNAQVAEAMRSVQEQHLKPLVKLDAVGRRLERQRATVLGTLAATDDIKQKELQEVAAKDAAEFPAIIKSVRESDSDERHQKLIAKLATAIDKSRDDGLAAVLDKLGKGQFVEADAVSQLRYQPQIEAAAKTLDEVVRGQADLAESDYRDAVDLSRRHQGFILLMVAAALIAGLALAAIMGRAVQRALGAHEQALAAGASRLAQGELFDRIAVDRGAAESVAASLNAMAEHVATLVRQVSDGAGAVAQTAKRLSDGSDELAMRTSGQAANLEETAASAEELSATVTHNAQRAEDARRLMNETSTLASAGGDAMVRVEETMSAISESSKRIAEFTSTIDSIAFQTNILALNAAVEAARAGETGRGFAVVAAEVRSLSQRSAEAAREIRALIQESAKRSAEGREGVDDAAGRIRAVIEASRGVTSAVGEIASATREQKSGIEQLNEAITQLESVTQRNAEQADRTARDAQEMSARAASLVAALSRFSLDQGQREAAEVIARVNERSAIAAPNRSSVRAIAAK